MRYLLLLVICCVIIPINGGGSSQYAYGQNKHSDSAQQPNKPALPKTINIETINVKNLDVEKQSGPAEHADQDNKKPNSYLNRLVSAELFPNTVLAIIGIIGIPVAICTLRIIKNQTSAIFASVKLQEISLRQWVTLTNWQYTIEKSEAQRLNLLFDVTNPTQIPLDLDLVLTKITTQESSQGSAHWLTPNNPYTVSAAFALSDDQFVEFNKSKLIVNLRCDVFYTDAQNNQWNQIFDRILVFNRTSTEVFVLESRTQIRDSTPTKASIAAALKQHEDNEK